MVLFFYGPNSYAARQKLRELTAQYHQKTGSDYGVERLDGATVTLPALAGALQAVPFLATSRLVIVENLAANRAVAANVAEVIDLVPVTTVVVFYEPEVDQRTVYFKAMTKAASVKGAKFAKLQPAALTSWIARLVRAEGGSIQRPAVELLLETCGDDQWRLEQEIKKLVSYQPEVSVETVRQLVSSGPAQTIFDLVDALAGGRPQPALTHYRNLRQSRTAELYILTMIIWQLRNLLLAKAAGPLTAAELAKRAGLSPYAASKALQKQRNFDEATLRQAFIRAVETDYAIKSGGGQADALIERLIYDIATSN